jgi:RND family efflux transporter MFP subunit
MEAERLQVAARGTRFKVELAKVLIDQAELQLSATSLRAPFDGVIYHRTASVGEFVGGEQPARALFTLARIDPLRLLVQVPEEHASQLKVGIPVVVQCRGKEAKASLTRLSPVLDPEKHSLQAEADIPAQNAPGLYPGMQAQAVLELELHGVWTVPVSAVQQRRPGDKVGFCYLIENGKAVQTTVRLGLSDGRTIQVLGRYRTAGGPGSTWREFTGHEKIIPDLKSTKFEIKPDLLVPIERDD